MREVIKRKSILSYFERINIIYDKFNKNNHKEFLAYNFFSVDKLKSLRNNDFLINTDKTLAYSDPQNKLTFDSRF